MDIVSESEPTDTPDNSIIEVGPLFKPDGNVRDMSVHELKTRYRQEQHLFYWLRGFTYEEISNITGWGKNTIWEDLKVMRDMQSIDGNDLDTIRNEALMNLMFDRGLALRLAEQHPRQSSKFLNTAVGIDKLILSRYTQPQNENTQAVREAQEQMKMMIDFMIEKMGPDVMDDFAAWWETRKKASKAAKRQQPPG